MCCFQDYLTPLRQQRESGCDQTTLGKLELFSLRLFKLALERAKTVIAADDSSCQPYLLKLCRLSVSSLATCAGTKTSRGKIPPLSFEKLLLHFLQLCVTCNEFSDVLKACRMLRERLRGGEGEGGTLLKHAFDLVWKAALSLEQRAQQEKGEKTSDLDAHSSDGGLAVAEQCLSLREEALGCLVSTHDTDAVFAVERIMRCSQRYQQVTKAQNTADHCFERLHKFHSCLLSLRDLPSLLVSGGNDKEIFLGVDYLCHVARVFHQAGHAHQGVGHLARVRKACCGGGGRRELCDKKPDTCKSKDNSKCLASALVNLSSALICLECQTQKIDEEEVTSNLESSSRDLEKVMGSDASSDHLLRLWEAVEQVFVALWRRRAAVRERGEDPGSLLPRGAFPSFVSLVIWQVKMGEGLERQSMAGDRGKTSSRVKEVRK